MYRGGSPTGTPAHTITVSRSGGSWSVGSDSLEDGTWTVQATQSDAAGNVAMSDAHTFEVDTSPPAVTLTTPSPGASLNDSQPVLAGAAGNAEPWCIVMSALP